MARLTLRIDLNGRGSIGPGKVRLLELIDEMGSIRRAGARLKMSYARAWGLVQDLRATFGKPVVDAAPGGRAGGGATLTPLGHKIVAAYRAAERNATKATARELAALTASSRAREAPRRNSRARRAR